MTWQSTFHKLVFKWPSPASFSFIFGLFQTNINTILLQIYVKNGHPVYSARLWNHDLQYMSLLHREPLWSPPITIRQVLSSLSIDSFIKNWFLQTILFMGSGVAQLVEWSLPIPEVRGLNPVIGKIYWPFVYCQLYWKDENTEKEAGNGPFLKIKWMLDCLQLGKFNFSFCTCFYVKTDPTYVLMQVVYRLSRKWFQPLTHVYTCLLGITK